MTNVTLLTTHDCGLCEQAKEVLERLTAEFGLNVQHVDVASDTGRDLAQRAGMAFPPGVLIDDKPFSYGRLSERKLRRALASKGGNHQ